MTNAAESFWLDAHQKAVAQSMLDVKGFVELKPSCYIQEVVSATLTYYGRAYGTILDTDPYWQVIRQTTNSGVTRYEAAGDAGYKYKWSDRATLFQDPGTLVAPASTDLSTILNQILTAIGVTNTDIAASNTALAAILAKNQNYGFTKATKFTGATLAANTSVLMIPANPNRKGFTVYNNSTNSMYVCIENPAVAANLIDFCGSNAGTTSLVKWTGPGVPTQAICGIRNAGTGSWTAWEFE